ncbi:hypothetical protein QJS04_geneDACA013311 [Acorus gramineus]|uniref:Calcineurin-like phosphoesterase domain-containing protein n=1 Tax=Acorus gramineus TaxID=55184 RepID=A0AAV9A278_ACOGR|nr:hypothetical protein QJS04_geneDACA018355 [Acorus gramineus]KAK1260099.1 hypothetical protein QJS04_geneDACA013311 [Acorus gramineus]
MASAAAFAWRTALPLLIVAALVAFEEWVSIPSCEVSSGEGGGGDPKAGNLSGSEDLKLMIVADLLLMGSEAGPITAYFRDSYTAKFFRKSLKMLDPDMLVILGDISARGSQLKSNKWSTILQQLQKILGPFLELPLHIILGDRDIGSCNKINANLVREIASNLPGLDSVGCGAFEISNISFVSVNTVPMLCGNNDLLFSVEKFIERESVDMSRSKIAVEEFQRPTESRGDFNTFHWRENDVPPGAGSVLLLHFPLHQVARSSELLKTLPQNATEYIIQALKPRIVFSAHTHQFCDHTHGDGTREVTVPAMTWAGKDQPGFVVAKFSQNKTVLVSHCSLSSESHVLMVYVTALVLLALATFLMYLRNSENI